MQVRTLGSSSSRYYSSQAPQNPPSHPAPRITSWPLYHRALMTVIPSGTSYFLPAISTVTIFGRRTSSWSMAMFLSKPLKSMTLSTIPPRRNQLHVVDDPRPEPSALDLFHAVPPL